MLNIHSEHSIRRVGNGVELVNALDTGLSLIHANEMPFNIYIVDASSETRYANEMCADIIGYDSIKSALGKSIFDVTSYESAIAVRNHDIQVMRQNNATITEEELERDDYLQRCLSFKYPLYKKDEIVGVFGCSIFYERDTLTTALAQIVNMGLLDSAPASRLNTKLKKSLYDFTKREEQCLYYSVRGKSAREIGVVLNLSRRTVEQYLENVKFKMGVRTRSEMLEIGWDVLIESKISHR